MYTHLIGQVYHVKVKTILSRISTQEKFPRTENLKVENFQLDNCFPISLGPVYEFVCVSFTTGNLNCFRVK
jgi:hypothetical protein